MEMSETLRKVKAWNRNQILLTIYQMYTEAKRCLLFLSRGRAWTNKLRVRPKYKQTYWDKLKMFAILNDVETRNFKWENQKI